MSSKGAGLPLPERSIPSSSTPPRPEFTFLLMSVPPSTVLNTEQMAELGFDDPKPYRRSGEREFFFRAPTELQCEYCDEKDHICRCRAFKTAPRGRGFIIRAPCQRCDNRRRCSHATTRRKKGSNTLLRFTSDSRVFVYYPDGLELKEIKTRAVDNRHADIPVNASSKTKRDNGQEEDSRGKATRARPFIPDVLRRASSLTPSAPDVPPRRKVTILADGSRVSRTISRNQEISSRSTNASRHPAAISTTPGDQARAQPREVITVSDDSELGSEEVAPPVTPLRSRVAPPRPASNSEDSGGPPQPLDADSHCRNGASHGAGRDEGAGDGRESPRLGVHMPPSLSPPPGDQRAGCQSKVVGRATRDLPPPNPANTTPSPGPHVAGASPRQARPPGAGTPREQERHETLAALQRAENPNAPEDEDDDFDAWLESICG